MKKLMFLIAAVILLAQQGHTQSQCVYSENFDGGSHSFNLTGSWQTTTDYFTSSSKSIIGFVPNISGDSIILESPMYDLRGYSVNDYNVLLKFNHICKISSSDIVRIEYRQGTTQWESITNPLGATYLGTANNYTWYGFSANNYLKWKAKDSTAIPGSGWWQEEVFDIGYIAAGESIQFRFILKRGNVLGSNISYGWLIDDFGIYVSERHIVPPTMRFLSSYPINTVYKTGPYDIRIEVNPDTATKAALRPIYLKYTSTYNNVSTTDSVLMNPVSGDTMFRGSIPAFKLGTTVIYSITATDTNGNSATLYGGYTIDRLATTTSGYTIVGEGTNQRNNAPISTAANNNYSWSKQLYLADEIEPLHSSGGLITRLAWQCASNTTAIYDRQICYLQATDEDRISGFNYDPIYNGAEQVWTGTFYITQGWSEIVLDEPFLLLPGQNLLVYWSNNNGTLVSTNWMQTSTDAVRCVTAQNQASFPAGVSSGTTSLERPNIRLYLQGNSYANNSAIASSMVSPTQQSLMIGQQNSIDVNIRNTGSVDLTSVIIHWKVNNGVVNSENWNGNLQWDEEAIFNLGDFIPSTNSYDTILVWTTMPNGVADSSLRQDTLVGVFYGCMLGGMSGSYTIGEGGTFPDLAKAMERLNYCGVNGNITFKYKSGIYNHGLSFTDFGTIMGNYYLTITSEKNNRDSVIFRPISGVGIKLAQSKNIIFDAITIDVQQTLSHGINILSVCSNIVINNCAIFADTNTLNLVNHVAIYKYITTAADTIRNITITNNFINGGHRFIMFSGAAPTVNMRVDSNIFKNNLQPNTMENVHFSSFSYNTISSRYHQVGGGLWTGIGFTNCSGNVIGNKIHHLSVASTFNTHIGISLSNHNRNSTEQALIANNEVVIRTGTGSMTGVGIAITSSKLKLYHNSILGRATGAGSMIGIQLGSSDEAFMSLDIRNNNIVLDHLSAYPIFLQSVNFLHLYNFASNNYSAPSFVASLGGTGIPNLLVWRMSFPNDVLSISNVPNFIDETNSLELSDYANLDCERLDDIPQDIQGNNRGLTTAIGCYTFSPYNVDAILNTILNWNTNPVTGDMITPKIVFTNGGYSSITTATIGWEFNGSIKTPVSLSKTLNSGQSDTINLGAISYANYTNQLTAWINSINGDQNLKNDTLTVHSYACDSPLDGNYTIDAAIGDFESISDAVQALYECGVMGNVTFFLSDGIYAENILFAGMISGSDTDKIITFTSASGNADRVTIKRIGETTVNNAPVVLRDNAANLKFSKLTMDGRTDTEEGNFFHAIMLEGVNNIEIDSCVLTIPYNANIMVSDNQNLNYTTIFNNTGKLKDIRITNNIIEGGVTGVYLNGSANATKNNRILIKNNIIRLTYKFGIYVNFGDSILAHNNTITQRSKSGVDPADFSGISYANYTGEIIGNKIRAFAINNMRDMRAGGGPTGLISIAFQNNLGTTPPTLIANNEIIGTTSTTAPGIGIAFHEDIYGGYPSYPAYYEPGSVNAAIYHNSIFITGTGAARGIGVNDMANVITAKNNNIVMMTSANDYPVYLENSVAANWANYTFDYNNYYSQRGTYVGYAGANRVDLTAWSGIVTSDQNSVVQKPYFANTVNSLLPASTEGLSCPQLLGVADDINGLTRPATTLMGAYQLASQLVDIHPVSLALPTTNPTVGTPVSIDITLYNAGTTTITSADIYWSENGVNATTPYQWTGSLAADSTTTLSIGTFNPIAGNNEIIAWTNLPNAGVDNNVSNDTVKLSAYACLPPMDRVYTIGNSGDYLDIESALLALRTCGMNDNVTFAFLPGDYIVSINLGAITGQGTNTITFTSQSGNAANTILRSDKDRTLATLNGTNSVYFNNLTLDAQTGIHAIHLTGTNNNTKITNCIIWADSSVMTNSKSAIFQGTGNSNNLYIVNNIIDGGYYGIYGYGLNIVCDSNTVKNSGRCGIYLSAASGQNIKSASNNIVTSRKKYLVIESNVNEACWEGLNIIRPCETITSNIIKTLTPDILRVRGININNLQNTVPMLISNNDVIVQAKTTGYGIYINNTKVHFIHNSCYAESGSPSAALYLTSLNDNTNGSVAKNNNLIAGLSAHAINIGGGADFMDMDYNNYHALPNIGMIQNELIPTFNDWKTRMSNDVHSINVLPNFINTSINLEYNSTMVFQTPLFHSVPKDIKANPRTTPTIMGAYGLQPKTLDMGLFAILDVPQKENLQGMSILPRVVLSNTGSTNLSSAQIYWEYNGVGQTIPWSGSLSILESDTIDLDTIKPLPGNHQLSVYILSVNAAGLDNNQQNDTLTMNFQVCPSYLNGDYTVGAGGYFANLTDAVNALTICGVSNDVRFLLQDGIYVENIHILGLSQLMGNYKLEIVSASNHADSVVIRPTTGSVFRIENCQNITVNAITIDARLANSYGIELMEVCKNITISNCRFLADTITEMTGNTCIYRKSLGGNVVHLDNITIDSNIICGGRIGIDIYHANNVKINDNLIYNQYETGISIVMPNSGTQRRDITSNTILSRISNIDTDVRWSGIVISGVLSMNGNKIRQRDINRKNSSGIELGLYTQGLISNNEIIACGTTDVYGINATVQAAYTINMLFNSIYLQGNAAQYGIQLTTSSTSANASTIMNIQNNNIVLESDRGYPISAAVSPLSVKNFNYNNYYAPVFIARSTTNPATIPYAEYSNLSLWRAAFPNDRASVNIKPDFIDVSQNLMPSDFTGLYCALNATVSNDINNNIRTNPTAIGAYGLFALYNYDLSLIELDGLGNTVSLCSPDYIPIEFAIFNAGQSTYYFDQDTLALYFHIDGLKGVFDTTVYIGLDTLEVLQTKLFNVVDFIDVSFAGEYHISAWISSNKDINYSNDTLRMIYKTNKIALPYEEDFSTSNISSLVVDNLVGTNAWHVVQGADAMISPDFGTGMLVFDGSVGTISSLKIGQIELERTIKPQLEFWYAHDNSEHTKRDQMLVWVTWNGGTSTKLAHEIMRYDTSCTTPTWKQYTVDLSPYVDSACVVVSLEAQSFGGMQHIDKIAVTSSHNLALDTVLISDYSLCNLTGKEIKVVLSNKTNQRYNFSEYPTDIIFEVGGSVNMDSSITLSVPMEAFETDTITLLTNFNFEIGNPTNIIVYLKVVLGDANRLDDTIRTSIIINPALSVTINKLSDCVNSFVTKEAEVGQTVVVTNTGNMDLSGINLILDVHSDLYNLQTTGSIDFLPSGGSETYVFANKFTVPVEVEYYIDVLVYLDCDSVMVNADTSETECVDMNDLYMISINEPTGTGVDKVGETINIKVSIGNHCFKDFDDVEITALIVGSDGQTKDRIDGTIGRVGMSDTVEYDFSRGYAVPAIKDYKVIVYFKRVDNYNFNDTMFIPRTTDHVGIKDVSSLTISMEQNTPNPAKESTLIKYSVPQDGEVSFKIYSVSGQILYNNVENVQSGDHQIEINTANFAAGIYFYTMEFEGQRITRRMSKQ